MMDCMLQRLRIHALKEAERWFFFLFFIEFTLLFAERGSQGCGKSSIFLSSLAIPTTLSVDSIPRWNTYVSEMLTTFPEAQNHLRFRLQALPVCSGAPWWRRSLYRSRAYSILHLLFSPSHLSSLWLGQTVNSLAAMKVINSSVK